MAITASTDRVGFRVAVLENDHLRATFLLELGGRLWSLLHKPTGRELLSVNPVFQPANLAIRNAWFSGGVEWNIAHDRPFAVHLCADLRGRASMARAARRSSASTSGSASAACPSR